MTTPPPPHSLPQTDAVSFCPSRIFLTGSRSWIPFPAIPSRSTAVLDETPFRLFPVRPMRALHLAALICLMCACTRSADSITSGAMSDRLLLTCSYEPSAQQFQITLGNQSKSAIRLQVESRRFHGRIVVAPAVGKHIEYVDSAYLPQMLTSQLEVPVCTLQPGAKITWTLPASLISDIHGNKLDPQTLHGATFHAKLDEVAVVPSNGKYIFDNAKQASASATIPN